MKIQPTQNSTQFKSAYPVVHWVRETNGSYAPAASKELNQKLQRIVVRFLNNQGKNIKPEKLTLMKQVKKVISANDKDYAKNPIARSFYNSNGGWKENGFNPIGYIITGKDAECFTNRLGKPIGKAKSNAPKLDDSLRNTAEVNLALGDYFKRGLYFVKNLVAGFNDNQGIPMGLHTKFEVIRTKTGRIKEYRLEDLRFCPEKGPQNPLVKTGYIKE